MTNVTHDMFGLPLQFEIDGDFYSKENRLRRMETFTKLIFNEHNLDHFSEDEYTYFDGKLDKILFDEGFKWGMKSSSGEGIASWDEPYRKCVQTHNIDE